MIKLSAPTCSTARLSPIFPHFGRSIVLFLFPRRKFSFTIPLLRPHRFPKFLLLYCLRTGAGKCPSTNTSATNAKANSRKSSLTDSRRSPAQSVPAERPPFSSRSLVPLSPAARRSPPLDPQVEVAPAVAAAAAATESATLIANSFFFSSFAVGSSAPASCKGARGL